MKHFKNSSAGKKGFTLAELLIVVAIIGVLVAIAIPIFTTQLEKSREATDLANMRAAKAAAVATYLDDNTAAGTYYFDAQKGVLTTTAPSTGYGKGTAKVGDTNNVLYDSNGQCYDPSVSNAGKYITVTITDSNAADGTATISLAWAGGSNGSGSGGGEQLCPRCHEPWDGDYCYNCDYPDGDTGEECPNCFEPWDGVHCEQCGYPDVAPEPPDEIGDEITCPHCNAVGFEGSYCDHCGYTYCTSCCTMYDASDPDASAYHDSGACTP